MGESYSARCEHNGPSVLLPLAGPSAAPPMPPTGVTGVAAASPPRARPRGTMAEPPPIIRIRCEGSEDECCSSGGEEVAAAAQWGLSRHPRHAPISDKRHSAPEVRPGVVTSSGQLSRVWLAPQHSGGHPGGRYSLPQLLARSPAGEKRLSAPSCLAPPSHGPLSPFSTPSHSHYGSRRCSVDEVCSSFDDFWHYRRLCRLHRRRFSDTARLDIPGMS